MLMDVLCFGSLRSMSHRIKTFGYFLSLRKEHRKLLQVVEQISLLNKVLPKVFLSSFIALFRKFPFSRFSLKQGLDRMILSVLFNGTFVNREVITDDVKM